MTLIHQGKFNLTGRGTVYAVSLIDNHLPRLRKDVTETLMGKEVVIDEMKYEVKGIEMFGTAEEYLHSVIGLLVNEK